MFRMWGKLFKENRLLADSTVCNDDPEMSRTKKVFSALDTFCADFDLSTPSGWIRISENLNAIPRPGSTRIILWKPLILIIWRSRYWRRMRRFETGDGTLGPRCV